MASGGTTALTRLPSGRRASTMGEDSSMRRPILETILSMVRRRWASSLKVAVDPLELALALQPDVERAVDHDLGDAVVAQVGLDRSVAEDVVGDLLGDPLPVHAGQRPVAGRHHVGQGVADHRLELGRGQVGVVQLGAQLDEQLLVDALLELVEPALARSPLRDGLGRGGGALPVPGRAGLGVRPPGWRCRPREPDGGPPGGRGARLAAPDRRRWRGRARVVRDGARSVAGAAAGPAAGPASGSGAAESGAGESAAGGAAEPVGGGGGGGAMPPAGPRSGSPGP